MAFHSIACLRVLGLVDASNLVTYAELHPEDYGNEKIVWDTVYAETSFPTENEIIYDSGEATSIGIIGGADGPTSVYVTAG